MKAQNLTISIPYKGCDKNCPYCVSKMTWAPRVNESRIIRNTEKVLKFAENSGINNVLITGKGEPLLNFSWISFFAERFNDFPLEIQTNGIKLLSLFNDAKNRMFHNIVDRMNVIAISIDHIEQIRKYSEMLKAIDFQGAIVRLCVNMTNMIGYDIFKIIDEIRNVGSVRQILFRNITTVSGTDQKAEVALWIRANTNHDLYKNAVHDFLHRSSLSTIRTIPETGVNIYDYYGISVCFSDYCIQHTNDTTDIRSLIFHQDGHLYTSWDSPASVLF